MPIIKHSKDLYLTWFSYFQKIPKIHRHTLGLKIDNLLVEIIESLSTAAFLKSDEKKEHIKTATRKNDTLKILLMVLWESGSLDNKKYIRLSKLINELGKMLGGWLSHLQKQNSPSKS